MELKDYKELGAKWNAIKKDKDRLAFLKENNKTMKVVLDNDISYANFIIPDAMDDELSEIISDIHLESFND